MRLEETKTQRSTKKEQTSADGEKNKRTNDKGDGMSEDIDKSEMEMYEWRHMENE